MVVVPPGHRKSAVFNSVVRPLQQFEAEAAAALAPTIVLARRRRHAAEQALVRAQDAVAQSLNSVDGTDEHAIRNANDAPIEPPRSADDTIASRPGDDRRAELLAAVECRLEDLAALEVPVVPRLITDDCSPERLATLLAEHGGRLAILGPEGGIFDMIAGRYP